MYCCLICVKDGFVVVDYNGFYFWCRCEIFVLGKMFVIINDMNLSM